MILPETWIESRLGQVLNRVDAKIDPQTTGSISYRYIGLEHIESNTGRLLQSAEAVSEGSEILSIKTVFQRGDILYGKLRPNLNKAYLAENDGICSTDIWALRTTEVLLPEFAACYLRSQAVFLRAAQLAVGANLPRISAGAFDRIPMLLPTIPEQQRIVDMLRKAEELGVLRDAFNQTMTLAKQQLFVELLGDPTPQFNAQWPIVKLGDFVDVATGGTPSREQFDSYGGSIPWVKSTDLKDHTISSTDECLSESGIQRSNARVYPKETVLLAMYGQGQTRGRTGKLSIEASCNQACAALLPNDELLPDYLWVWFQLFYHWVRSLGRGGQQENLNLDIIRSIRLPKPPIHLQKEFSRRLTVLRELSNVSRSSRANVDRFLEVLRIELLTGDATVLWRSQSHSEIAEAVIVRDELLRKRGVKVARTSAIAKSVAPGSEIPFRLSRAWLMNELSEFQLGVFYAFSAYAEQPLLAEDPDIFARFCDSPEVIERLEPFGPALNNRIRRTLSQLSALGLVAKVTLPKQNQETGEREYLKAFRPLKEEEFTRLADAAALRKALGSGGEPVPEIEP